MKRSLIFFIALIGSTAAANAGCIFGSRLIAAPTCQVQFAPLVPAFYVSNAGNDTNAGTAVAPFLTITKAQTAMRASGTIKTTYIRGGTYAPAAIANCDGSGAQFTCMLSLNSSDNGETFSYYPPDGYDTAIFTGGSTGVGTGLFYMIYSTGSTGVTINGLTMHDFQYSAYRGGGGDAGPTVENNIIYNGWITTQNTSPGAISCYGCSNMKILNNVIHDIGNWGVNMTQSSGDISGLIVSGNVIYNTCTGRPDCAAVYMVDTPQTATNITWTNNYIRDGNTGATLGSGFGSAMYADDCASNVTAAGNIITGKNGSNTILIHGGLNNHFNGNLTDLGPYQQSIMAEQTSSPCTSMTMSGNQYEHNIVIGQGGGGGYNLLSGTPPNAPAILDNAYFNYGIQAIYGDTVVEGPTFTGAPGFNRANPISVSAPGKTLTASIYLSVAAGNVEVAIYDSTGPNSGPGNLVVSTASTAAAAGWNTIPFTSQVSLSAGKYYMAWQADNATAQFNYRGAGTDPYYAIAYGPFAAVYSTSPSAGNAVISEYVTIATSNLGDTAIEATPQTSLSGSIVADPITISSTTSPIVGSIYIPTVAGNVQMAIYDNAGSGGKPGNLKASTGSLPAVAGWNALPFLTQPVLTSGTYYVVFMVSSSSAQVVHDATSPGFSSSLAYGPFPSTFSGSTSAAAKYSSFITFAGPGGAISSGGNYSDSVPTTEDPQLTCWAYTISGASPVFNAPVNFPGLVQGLGPPGFVIPQTGTPPSSPHTC